MKVALANAEFNCRVFGNGEKIIIAFHGFGQDGSCFQELANNRPDLTIYTFDLPFHGSTNVHDKRSFILGPEQVYELIEKFLQLADVVRFSIVAFSIGVRLVFPIVEKFGKHMDQLILLAPDGITDLFWYRITTFNSLTRFLFRKVLNSENVLKKTGTVLSKIRLIDQRNLLFALRSLNSPEKREKVYHTWIALRFLRSDMLTFSKMLDQNGIELMIILGEKDGIIKRSAVKPLLKMAKNANLVMLPCGHANMIDCFTKQKNDVL